MGIKSLSKFLKQSYSEVFELIHISEYHFRKVAIDTSLYLCNYKALYGEEGWLGAFVKLVSCLRENEIHCVFIYDSGFPPEKEQERKHRMESRTKLDKKVSELELAIEKYHNTGEIDNILVEFQDKKNISHKSIMRPATININSIEYLVKKMRKQLFSITQKDFEITKQLFDILKVPYYNSALEAETMCADLCLQGEVDAVLSEDTDVLAYGAHTFLTKVNTANGTCLRVKYSDVLEKTNLSSEQFLDFCIMCGTDYNKNIFRIGPSKALSLIQKYDNIENISDQAKIDVKILNHHRVRQLFREYQKTNVKVPYCGTPDFTELQKFLFIRNLRIDTDSLRKSFIHNIIIFEDDNEKTIPE
jgi:5'-3' exonuclease